MVSSFFRKTIAVLHWIFYGFLNIMVILHAEIWFYGVKINGHPAITIVSILCISGMLFGFFILKGKRNAYFGSLGIAMIMFGSYLVNHLTA